MKAVKGTSCWLCIALACGVAAIVGAQTQTVGHAQVMLSSGGLVPETSQSGTQGEVLREIDDVHTGDRWLLIRNEQTPGGPGRLVLVSADHNGIASTARRGVGHTEEAVAPPIIRSGDRLIIEKHTAVVDAVLEARAVTPAAVGAAFDVRLTLGGKVVRAVALGPGRAAFQETGARP